MVNACVFDAVNFTGFHVGVKHKAPTDLYSCIMSTTCFDEERGSAANHQVENLKLAF